MVEPYYTDTKPDIAIYNGDCRAVMAQLEPESVDSVVCDPPYELGFMGKGWDRSGIAYDVQVWRECLRVLKPGGHLLAFGGSRTYHRLACAIEDAGLEIRDQIQWIYGSGFPKSLDVSKAVDGFFGAERQIVGPSSGGCPGGKLCTHGDNAVYGSTVHAPTTTAATWAARQWEGWGTALKPAHEPIALARKPLVVGVAENILIHGAGGLNINGCRVDAPDGKPVFINGVERDRSRSSYDTGGSNRTGEISHEGRWPANVIHDGSEEVVRLFPETDSSRASMRGTMGESPFSGIDGSGRNPDSNSYRGHNDNGGSAARFFYVPKADKADREEGLGDLPVLTPGQLTNRKEGSAGLSSPRAGAGRANSGGGRNSHPTVKPVDLMRYLCRLVTPPHGLVLDPFCGSGSTGKAARAEDFRFIGIEINEEYCALAAARCEIPQRSLFME